MDNVDYQKLNGAVTYNDYEPGTFEWPINDIKPKEYYRFRYQHLEINGNTTKITTENGTEIIVCTENIILENLPTNVTVGTVAICFEEN